MRLTHTDEQGAARMVDVGGKPVTAREAVAEGSVRMSAEAFALVRDNAIAKGDVLGIARIAGIAGAKRTADLVPLCHPIALDVVEVDAEADPEQSEGARKGTFWYAPLLAGDAVVPVRMQLETQIGTVDAYLAELHGRGVDLRLME